MDKVSGGKTDDEVVGSTYSVLMYPTLSLMPCLNLFSLYVHNSMFRGTFTACHIIDEERRNLLLPLPLFFPCLPLTDFGERENRSRNVTTAFQSIDL